MSTMKMSKTFYRDELIKVILTQYPEFVDKKLYPYLMVPVNENDFPKIKGYNFFVVRDQQGKDSWRYIDIKHIGTLKRNHISPRSLHVELVNDSNEDIRVKIFNQCKK